MYYSVRVKINNQKDWLYANRNFLMSKKEIEERKFEHTTFKDFLLDKKEAETLYTSLLFKRDDLEVRIAALVEMSHYEPYPEHAVTKYQEKKAK